MDATRWLLVLVGLLADLAATGLISHRLELLGAFLRVVVGSVFVAWVVVIAESVE